MRSCINQKHLLNYYEVKYDCNSVVVVLVTAETFCVCQLINLLIC